MNETGNDHYLMTPGPLTTSRATKEAMLRDWGSREQEFIDLCARVRRRLLELSGAAETHECVMLQGSGTFAIEATLQTLIPREGRLLVLVNGAYGRRMASIVRTMGRTVEVLECPEHLPCEPGGVDVFLTQNPDVTDVAVVYCETTTGIINPIDGIAGVVKQRGRRLHIDAMSAFGALPVDAAHIPFDSLTASSNKCLEGVPGMGFSIIRRSHLATCEGVSSSVSLDLYEQWRGFERNGQWRFTPPTHVMAALDAALDQLRDEGGVAGRLGRYQRNCGSLVAGMRALGFKTLLKDSQQAPIIVTFLSPEEPEFEFQRFYDCLKARGFVIYPGKLTTGDTFRIGCIGQVDHGVVNSFLTAVRETTEEMGLTAYQGEPIRRAAPRPDEHHRAPGLQRPAPEQR